MSKSYVNDLKYDFYPAHWLSKYRRNDVPYLIILVLFYHALGFIFTISGSIIVDSIINNYDEPAIPITGISVITAGPIEETIFFGIPLYVTGNNFFALVGGLIWSMFHILNTPSVQVSSLAYANWLFTIPSIFLSYRTWISGKGWFSIVAHSSWNILFFVAGCTVGQFPCRVISNDNVKMDISSVLFSGLLIMLTFLLYKRYHRKKQNVD